MPKVSIIIPVYNVEQYLRQCLDSVVNQTLQDIEIICVNDGSTDNSLKILEEYAQKDDRIKIINQENRGLSIARNEGMEHAQGEYIGFVDSDDWIDLDFYEKLYKRGVETDSDVVVCEYTYIVKDKHKKIFLKVSKDIVTTSLKEKFENLYLPYYCYVWNKIYKRQSLTERFIKDIKWEDIYFTPNTLLQCNKYSVASDISYYYRNNSKSIVNDKSNINQYFYHSGFTYFYDFVCKNKIDFDTNQYHSIKKYKFLGLTIFKIKRWRFKTKYYLFNLISWSKI